MCRRKTLLLIVIALVSLVLFAKEVNALTFDISGNSAGSNNSIDVKQNNTTDVTQSNNANINNNVNSNADSGGNTINSGTGGSGSIKTGNATSNVNVTNEVNLNSAKVDGCCPTGTTPPPPPPVNHCGDPGQPACNPGGGNNNNGGGTGSSGGGSSSSGTGRAAVLGLSATDGPDNEVTVFYTLGSLCLITGSTLIGRKLFLS